MSNQIAINSLDLSSRFMLIRLSIKTFNNLRKASHLARDVETAKGMEANTCETKIKLLDEKLLFPPIQTRNSIYAKHREFTQVWDDTDWRLLPTSKYFDYFKTINPLIDEFNKRVAVIKQDYPAMLQEAKRRLNGEFNPKFYPQDMGDFYGVTIIPQEINTTLVGGLALPQEELDQVKAQMEAGIRANIARTMTETWDKVVTAASHLAKRIEDLNDTEKKTVIQTSLLGNLQAVIEELRAFDVAGDSAIDPVIGAIQSISNIEPGDLKAYPDIRASVKETAETVANMAQARMADFAGMF
jgi:hypothetical protein